MSKPDPSLLAEVVSPRVIEAMQRASAALTAAGVRHVVAGGLAVAANGYTRATTDAVFLVGDEAFETHPGGLVMLRPGVPFQVNGVAIDFLTVGPEEAFLLSAFDAPPGSFLEPAPLVYLKLKSTRLKDHTDVVELSKVGLDVDACRAYLQAHALALLSRFEALVARAAAE